MSPHLSISVMEWKSKPLALFGVKLNFWRYFHAILSPSVPSSGINVKYHAYAQGEYTKIPQHTK